jgi:Pilus formation protein N terminal region
MFSGAALAPSFPRLVLLMKKTVLSAIAAGTIVLMMGMTAAKAEVQTIAVEVDQSQILQLPATPGAIVIGNPSIADVSIQGQKLFIHGRSFGQTNLTILDLEGNQMANFNLIGTLSQDGLVTVYRGTQRNSLSCTGTCAPNLQIGDDDSFFQLQAKQIGAKSSLATGSQTAETKAPEIPQ